MKELESVTKALQRHYVTIADVRRLFNAIITIFPQLQSTISSNAGIVHPPEFEYASYKIQDEKVSSVDNDERETVRWLLKEMVQVEVEIDDCQSSLGNGLLKKRRVSDQSYIDSRFILPVSNQCERLFSISIHATIDRRKGMSPAIF